MAIGAERGREQGLSRWTMDLVAGPLLLPALVLGLALTWVLFTGAAGASWMVLAIFGIVISLAVLLVHDLRRLRRGPQDPKSPF